MGIVAQPGRLFMQKQASAKAAKKGSFCTVLQVQRTTYPDHQPVTELPRREPQPRGHSRSFFSCHVLVQGLLILLLWGSW